MLTRLVFAWAVLLATAASAQYSTGFENPPFNSGTINGQDQWTVSRNDATVRILTATEITAELTDAGLPAGAPVHGGSQALLVSGPGQNNATIRAVGGLEDQTRVLLDVWARPLTGGDGDPATIGTAIGNVFVTMEDSSGARAAAFRFGAAGGMQTIDYGTADQTGIWRSSGTLWDAGSWYRITMSLDYGAKTYDFFINGAQVNTSPIPFYTATPATFNQVRIFRGADQAGMIVDDLSAGVVPEPSATASLVLGAGAVFLRRRRMRR